MAMMRYSPASFTGTSPSDFLVLYPGHSADKQLVYSTAPIRLGKNITLQTDYYNGVEIIT